MMVVGPLESARQSLHLCFGHHFQVGLFFLWGGLGEDNLEVLLHEDNLDSTDTSYTKIASFPEFEAVY